MIIGTYTGATKYFGIDFDRPMKRLGIMIEFASDKVFADYSGLEHGKSPRASISVNTKQGATSEISNNMPLMYLSEYAAMLEGGISMLRNIPVLDDDGQPTANKVHRVIHVVEISEQGSLNLDDNESFLIELTECKTAATYTLFSMDDPTLVESHLKYSRKNTNNGLKTLTNVQSNHIIIQSQNVEEVTGTFANGYELNYRELELYTTMTQENDVVITDVDYDVAPLANTKSVPHMYNYYILDTLDIASLSIYSKEGTETEFVMVETTTL